MTVRRSDGLLEAVDKEGAVVASLTYKEDGPGIISTGQLWAAEGKGGAGVMLAYEIRAMFPDHTILALVAPDNERALKMHLRLGGEPRWVMFVHQPKEKKNGS